MAAVRNSSLRRLSVLLLACALCLRTLPTSASLVWTTQPPADVTVQCTAGLPAVFAMTAQSSSAGSITTGSPYYSYSTTNTNYSSCNYQYKQKRTWSVAANGETVTASQTVTMKDTNVPQILGIPPAISVACNAYVPESAYEFGSISVVDACDPRAALINDLPQDPLGYECMEDIMVYNRTWTAFDCAGNLGKFTQNVTFYDDAAPEWVVPPPASLTLECSQPLPTPPDDVYAQDNCDGTIFYRYMRNICLPDLDLLSLTEASTPHPTVPYLATVNRTWVARDLASHQLVHTQLIQTVDTTPPALASGTLANTSVACGTPVPAAPTLVFRDACDAAATVTFREVTLTRFPFNSIAAGVAQQVWRTWTAKDAARNNVTLLQIINITDTTPPVIAAAPPSKTLQCGVDHLPTPPTLLATDTCTPASIMAALSENLSRTTPSSPLFTVNRTWTATDSAGNSASATQILTYVDTLPPTLLNLPPTTLTSRCIAALPTPPNVTATDACGALSVPVTFTETRPSPALVLRTWSATDSANNTATFTQTITVTTSSQAPIWSSPLPANLTLECSPTTAPPSPAQLSATGSCSSTPLTVAFAQTLVNGSLTDPAVMSSLVNTWTVSELDPSVPNRTISQTVTIKDTMAPAFVGELPQASLVIECGSTVPVAVNLTAVDGCSGPVLVSFTEQSQRQGATEVITRVWQAADGNGNVARHQQVITIQDTTPPTFANLPATAASTYECGSALPFPTITALDACVGPLTVTLTTIDSGNPCTGRTLTHTYRATDPSINTVIYTLPPTLSDPATNATYTTNTTLPPTALPCSSPLPTPLTLTATDLCSAAAPPIVYSEARIPTACPTCYTLVRTWTALDACGAPTTLTHTLNITDSAAPHYAPLPTSATPPANLAATPDACLSPPNSKYYPVPLTAFLSKVAPGGCSPLAPSATAFASCTVYSALPPTGVGNDHPPNPIWPPSVGFGGSTGSTRGLLSSSSSSSSSSFSSHPTHHHRHLLGTPTASTTFDKKVDLCFFSAADQAIYLQADSSTWYDRVYVLALNYYDACNHTATLTHTVYVPSRPLDQYTWWATPKPTCQSATIPASRWRLGGTPTQSSLHLGPVPIAVGAGVVTTLVVAAVMVVVIRRAHASAHRGQPNPFAPRSSLSALLFGQRPSGEFCELRQASMTPLGSVTLGSFGSKSASPLVGSKGYLELLGRKGDEEQKQLLKLQGRVQAQLQLFAAGSGVSESEMATIGVAVHDEEEPEGATGGVGQPDEEAGSK